MKLVERLRTSLSLTPFEKKIIIFIFFMIFIGNIYNRIRVRTGDELGKETVMLYDEDEIVKVNINTAPFDSLILLPGVGKEIAKVIMDMRKKQRFLKPEDLLKIKGIGYKKLERMKPYLSFK